jgi:hypothetical protein
VKKIISLFLAAVLCLSILAGLSQTVCYAGEANPPAVGSPTEPDDTEDPDDTPNKLPTSGEETL